MNPPLGGLLFEALHSQGLFIATSAINYETDKVIQNLLRTNLRSDVTLVTVAHRLQTIVDADKIVCDPNVVLSPISC